MGTRSLTVFVDGRDEKEIVVLYRQMDGYPSGHGAELAKFLEPFTVVNGYGSEKGSVANGAGCLAAQVVAHFKKSVGSFYLHPAGTRDCGEEYIYTVTAKEGHIHVRCEADDKVLFDGSPKDFVTFCNEPQGE